MVRNTRMQTAPFTDWVLVANASRARVFERDETSQSLREVGDYLHPASRQKGEALSDDRPGHVHKGAASTAFAPHTDPREREHVRFARELSQVLETAAAARQMRGLVLIASSPFLGELQAELGDGARRLLKKAVALDLTSFSDRELERRVTGAIGEPA